ncbi:hypothetical protein [Agrococcus sp. Marseille-P2731]|uniref:hypothetical protein n=1 Tax=Agrococcus sp. Marseille-P2731 TaxID=1841862 RepID=UPI0009303AAB|nr:hypothetical protein [Agrococcus sp. Marseille-P2731]
MRHPHHLHENTHHHEIDGRQGREHEHRRGRGHEHREDRGHEHREAHAGPGHCHRSGRPDGVHPRGAAHRHPTLERSIMRSARRIRRAGLTPEQLHDRIATTVSHADYVTTMRTLRRIGMELRAER